MATKKKDASTFEGNGISFKAKLIGIEEVTEARGDLLCQEAITKLKNAVKISGQHKQKIFINVTLEGLKIIDAVSLTANQNKKKSDTRNSKTSVDSEEVDKTDDMLVLHTHPVHKISFISRDTTDNRAFGYIVGSGDGKHTFYAIKTAAAAEQLVLTLRDLFQVVYEMKKKEMDDAKVKLEESNGVEETSQENGKPSGEGSTSEEAQTQKVTPIAEGDAIYHVPSNNAPVKGSIAEQQANLLDLEDQADSILKGIEQIKNLDFDSMANDADKPLGSPLPPPVAQPTGTADPWAAPASGNTGNSSLGDLAGIQTGPFVNMQQQQQQQFFPGATFPGQVPRYNVAAVPGVNMTNAGLPVSRDPFGSDPFSANYQQPGVRPGFGAPGFGVANPFGGAQFAQPYQGIVRPPMPGMVPPSGMFPAQPANQNPFGSTQQEDPNMLKPLRTDQQGQDAAQEQAGSKSPKEDLFGDLLGIKKSTNDAKSPKDMFAQLTAADKKSMNELKFVADMPPKASFDMDPFMATGNVSEDKRRGLFDNEVEDPFDTSHILSYQSIPPKSTIPPSSANVPPVPQRLIPAQNLAEKSQNSSSSSSTLSSSHVSASNQIPSLVPPPPPNRVRNNPSPNLPPLITRSKNTTDVSNPSDRQAFVLPSPDEPPPPLPQDFIKSPTAPPPPPRPSSSKSLSSASPSIQHSSESSPVFSIKQPQSSPQTVNNSGPSFPTSFSDPFEKPNAASSQPENTRNMLKYDLTFKTNNDPFSIPLKSSSHNEVSKNKRNNNSHTNRLSHKSDKNSDTTQTSVEGKYSSSDSNSKSVISNPSSETNSCQEGLETDPFGLSLHVTPGFKAVARFGSDPFEDSFGASMNNGEQDLAKWDPFPDTPSPFDSITTSKLSSNDPWSTNASPFGDAFQPPPTNNNNASTGALMD